MEVKVKELIKQQDDLAKLIKELNLFKQSGVPSVSLSVEESEALVGILIKYMKLLDTILDKASVCI